MSNIARWSFERKDKNVLLVNELIDDRPNEPIEIAKILIVEDDEPTLLALSESLVNEGFICRPFADPKDAVEYAVTHNDYVAILTDIKMPGMSGLELLGQLRRAPEPMRSKPVVVVSGNATREDIQELLRLGAREFLDKPIDIDRLLETLKAIAAEARDGATRDFGSAAPELNPEHARLIKLLAHETRTPLNAVIGFSSLLLDPNLQYDRLEVVSLANLIHNAGEELLKKVNLILGTMTTSMKGTASYRPTLARRLISAALDCPGVLSGQKTHHLKVEDHTALKQWNINLSATVDALEQILLNALAYSTNGSTVTVTARDGGDAVILEVSDEGSGMTDEQARRALSLFSKADHSQVAIEGGLGLGLPFAKGQIEAQGGTLTIISPKHGGTMVRLTIPSAEPST